MNALILIGSLVAIFAIWGLILWDLLDEQAPPH